MKRHLLAFCLCLCLGVLACVEVGADSAEIVTVGFQDSQVRRMTFEELSQRKIWYEPVGDNAIRFHVADLAEITRIVEEQMYEVVPLERSVNYAEPVLSEFLKRLDKANVPYELIEYGDLDPNENDGLPIEWVVWPEEFSAEVTRIREALESDMLWEDFRSE